MKDLRLYKDIATRTNGDIYIGVVGPVRTGKSTFIKNFMDLLVKTFKRNKNRGVFFEYTNDSMFGIRLENGKWLEGGGKKFQYELFEI